MNPSSHSDPHARYRPRSASDEEALALRESLGNATKRILRFDLPFVILVEDTFTEVAGSMAIVESGRPFVASSALGQVMFWFRKKNTASTCLMHAI
ncbi:hypothetical protein [Hymenobacter sp. UYCo722]|uniref:hypothetical protein n=1 Tax=Hymenobacter sp. UYCo722 TaxID=3156335 RepID=UPI0033998DE6